MKNIEAAVLTAAIAETHGLPARHIELPSSYVEFFPVTNDDVQWQNTVKRLRNDGLVRLYAGIKLTRPVLDDRYKHHNY